MPQKAVFAQSEISLHNQLGKTIVTIKCEISNFKPTRKTAYLIFRVDDIDVEIQHLGWKDKTEIKEHGNAYQHALISARLAVQQIPIADQDRVIDHLNAVVELLSIARRGYVFVSAQHRYDSNEQWLDSRFDEPVFTYRGWPRPLIPDDVLKDFIQVAYPNLRSRYRCMELANVIDHYLQALTLRSVWPSSLGIFTAMETLRAAYFYQSEEPEDRETEFWVVPEEMFRSDSKIFDELITLLGHHFPRFCDLPTNERQSLKLEFRVATRRVKACA